MLNNYFFMIGQLKTCYKNRPLGEHNGQILIFHCDNAGITIIY